MVWVIVTIIIDLTVIIIIVIEGIINYSKVKIN